MQWRKSEEILASFSCCHSTNATSVILGTLSSCKLLYADQIQKQCNGENISACSFISQNLQAYWENNGFYLLRPPLVAPFWIHMERFKFLVRARFVKPGYTFMAHLCATLFPQKAIHWQYILDPCYPILRSYIHNTEVIYITNVLDPCYPQLLSYIHSCVARLNYHTSHHSLLRISISIRIRISINMSSISIYSQLHGLPR